MVRKLRTSKSKSDYVLKDWYPSDEVKRSFGTICQAVNEQGSKIELLGSEDRPFLVLLDEKMVPEDKNEVRLSIDEIKADWSSVTQAAMFFGTTFRIHGKRLSRAVIRRHPLNQHPALKYRRPQIDDLSQTMSLLVDELRKTTEHLDETTEIFGRNFKAIWREKDGLKPS